MRLRLDATPEELQTKGPELVKALADEIADANPELARTLEKALPRKEPVLKYKALRDLHDTNKAAYAKTLDAMIDDIEDVLTDPQTTKSLPIVGQDLVKANVPESVSNGRMLTLTPEQYQHVVDAVLIKLPTGAGLHKAEDEDPGAEPPDPDFDEETGDPITDPKTGLTPTETETAKEAGELDEDEENEKSLDGTMPVGHSVLGWEETMSTAKSLTVWNMLRTAGEVPLRKGRKTKRNPHGGPFMGPRGGLWADPDHKIHWDPDKHGRIPVKIAVESQLKQQDTGERHKDDLLRLKLEGIGDWLHRTQAENPRAMDAAGFSSNDMTQWEYSEVRGNTKKMQLLLQKYRRQITEKDPKAWWETGLGDPLAKYSVEWFMHPRFKNLNIRFSGFVPRDKFDKLRDLHREMGMWWSRNDNAYAFRKDAPLFDHETYREKLIEILGEVDFPEGTPPRKPTAEEKQVKAKGKREELQEALRTAQSPVDLVWQGLESGTIDNAVGVKWNAERETLEFRFPRGKVSSLFSNKRGGLPAVNWWDQSTKPWSVHVFDPEVAQLAIDHIKKLQPDWEVVTEGLEEALAAEADRIQKVRAPIPELEDMMGMVDEGRTKLSPFPHQNETVRFFQDVIKPGKSGGALLGDEMGTGKSLGALGYAALRQAKMLVICPMTVRRTWIEESDKFLPGQLPGVELTALALRKAKKNITKTKKVYAEWLGQNAETADDVHTADYYSDHPEVIPEMDAIVWALGLRDAKLATLNYESVAKFVPVLRAAGFDLMVMDESHRIKNPKAKLTQAIMAIGEDVPNRILMSGTAVKNDKMDFVTQFDLVTPGTFKMVRRINPHSGRPYMVSEIKEKGFGELWGSMRPFYLQRSKSKVLKDLPPKTLRLTYQPVEMAPDLPNSRKDILNNARYFAYADAREGGASHADAMVEGESGREAMVEALIELEGAFQNGETRIQQEAEERARPEPAWAEVLRDFGMRQITSSATVVGAYSRLKSALAYAKTEVTRLVVDEILEGSDSNILIFSNSRAAVRRLKEMYGDQAVTHYGADTIEAREAAKKLFHPDTRPPEDQNPPRILIGTMDTLKEGATLTSADKVIFNDLPWTAMEFEQAEARAHRPGQDKPVDVVWPVALGNAMDSAIATLLKYKVDLTRKTNRGELLSGAERKALETDVSMEEIIAALTGKAPAEVLAKLKTTTETVQTADGPRTVKREIKVKNVPDERQPPLAATAPDIDPPPIERTPVKARQTLYIEGDKAEYTGKAEMVHDQKLYEVRFLEGHRKGETRETYQTPEKEAAKEAATTKPIERQPVKPKVAAAVEQLKLFKALAHELGEPIPFDHTKDIADRDADLYRRVKGLVKRRSSESLTDADFDDGGRFHGYSSNQLLEWLREQRG